MSFEVGDDWPDYSDYKPLTKPREIRILTILPGSGVIECMLSHLDLGAEGIEQYSALSYAWGTLGKTVDILVNGQNVQLRETVWRFLSSLRCLANSSSRRVWIDILCIDQRDKPEKSRQVSMMHLIFSLATQVVVWLGAATESTNMAFQFLDEVDQQAKQSKDQDIRQALTKVMINLPNADAKRLPLCAQGLHAVYEHIVWTRLWILQEVVLGGNVVLLCGEKSLQLPTFLSLVRQSEKRSAPLISAFQVSLRLSTTALQRLGRLDMLLKQSFEGNNKIWDLAQMLRLGINLDCSDPRDKIFGILSMAGASARESIPVDYTKSLFEIFYTAFASLTQDVFAYQTLKLMSEVYVKMGFDHESIPEARFEYVQRSLDHHRSQGHRGFEVRWTGNTLSCTCGDDTLYPTNSGPWYRIIYRDEDSYESVYTAWSRWPSEIGDECYLIDSRTCSTNAGDWTAVLIILRLTSSGARDFIGLAHADQQSSEIARTRRQGWLRGYQLPPWSSRSGGRWSAGTAPVVSNPVDTSPVEQEELLRGTEILLPLPKYLAFPSKVILACLSADYEESDNELSERAKELAEFNRRRGCVNKYRSRRIRVFPNAAALLLLLDIRGNSLNYKKGPERTTSSGHFSALADIGGDDQVW